VSGVIVTEEFGLFFIHLCGKVFFLLRPWWYYKNITSERVNVCGRVHDIQESFVLVIWKQWNAVCHYNRILLLRQKQTVRLQC